MLQRDCRLLFGWPLQQWCLVGRQGRGSTLNTNANDGPSLRSNEATLSIAQSSESRPLIILASSLLDLAEDVLAKIDM